MAKPEWSCGPAGGVPPLRCHRVALRPLPVRRSGLWLRRASLERDGRDRHRALQDRCVRHDGFFRTVDELHALALDQTGLIA